MKTENNDTRKISVTGFLVFMGVMGILIGLFAIACQTKSHDDFLRQLNPIYAFLSGYIPLQLMGFLLWLAVRKAGHKDGIPIK